MAKRKTTADREARYLAEERVRRGKAEADAVTDGQCFRVVQWREESVVDYAPAYFPTLAAAEAARDRHIEESTAPRVGVESYDDLWTGASIEHFQAGAWEVVAGSERECAYKYLYATKKLHETARQFASESAMARADIERKKGQ